MLPIGVQLYSLRELAQKDFISVLKTVSEIGYKLVEPAGFWNIRPSEFRKIIRDLGMDMVSSHSPWARPGNLGEVMDIADSIGLKKIVCGFNPDDFKDMDSIKRTAETANKMLDVLSANGFTLFQHNHYWEFDRLDGRIKYEIYRDLCPRMKYQMDCFWSTNKGKEDAVAMLKNFAKDTVLLHMKDGKCVQNTANAGMVNGLIDMKVDLMPLGTGDLPIPELIAAAPKQCEAVIVELDYCVEEMVGAIRKSYEYLTSKGLAAGNK